MAIWKITKKQLRNLKNFLISIFNVLLKISCTLIVIFYVLFGVAATSVLIDREYIGYKPIEEVNSVIEASLLTNNLADISKWLSHRDGADIDYIVDAIKPKSGNIDSSLFFFIASRYYKLGNIDEFLFWFNYGQYRLRYDALRCGASEGIDVLSEMINLVHVTDIGKIYKNNPELVKAALKKMIEFDKAYPPLNDMSQTCFLTSQIEGNKELTIAPEEEWPIIRKRLIKSAQDFVNEK